MKLRNTSLLLAARPAAFLNSCNSFLARQRQMLRPALALLLILTLSAIALGQQAGTRSISFPTSIQWTRQKGIKKYRLQIASDETFRSIFFDGRVNGERYTASGLPPGYYYWRVAAADRSTGQFSTPVRFFVSGGAVVSGLLPDKTGRRARARTLSGKPLRGN
jgi:hypothetical protein